MIVRHLCDGVKRTLKFQRMRPALESLVREQPYSVLDLATRLYKDAWLLAGTLLCMSLPWFAYLFAWICLAKPSKCG